MKILVIEDEPDISEILCAYLRDAGYNTGTAGDGISAIEEFGKGGWDLILLDIMLPKIDGYGVCELIRQKSNIPIIMLTALDDEKNQLKGFDLKIDDYITKPFSIPVLLHKIAAILRRCNNQLTPQHITYKDISINLNNYEVMVDKEIVELTSREFEILHELIEHPGRVFTRSVLLDRLWNYDFLGDERIVDTHIKNLRKKLGRDYIETVRGVGYRVNKND